MDTHRLQRHHRRRLRRFDPGHERGQRLGCVGLEALGRPRGEQTRRGDARHHIGELELNGLVLADGLAEGRALLRVA
jgi:hypothetical protein